MRSITDLKDFGYLDEGRRKAQLAKKEKVIGGCFRDCRPSECANVQLKLKEVEGQETADLIIEDCREIEDTLDSDTKFMRALTGSRNGSRKIMTECERGCKKDKCNVCIAQACKVENKVHRLTRRVINFLNEGRTNNPCFSTYHPRVPLQLSEEYYEKQYRK